MSTTTNHKRTRIIALVTALLVVAGILGLAPRLSYAANENQGDLEITKQFAGEGLTGNEEAAFTVTVSDPAAGTTLPNTLTIDQTTVTAENNTFTFNLKTGQTAKFTNANPCKVSINETAMTDFTTTVSATRNDVEIEGVTSLPVTTVDIVKNTSAKVTVTNTKNKEEETTETGKLTVTKEVKGTEDATLKGTAFDFKVTLSDKENTYKITGDTTGTIEKGEGTFQLKNGQSVDIEGIPVGTKYTVTETEDPAKWTTTKTGDEGKIVKDGSTAAFTNTYVEPTDGKGMLKIGKNVVTDRVNKSIAYAEQEGQSTRAESLKSTKELIESLHFTFTVELKNSKGETDENRYNYSGTDDGKETTGTIKSGEQLILRHGDSITISDLPAGTTYTVTEKGLLDEGEIKYSNYWKTDEETKNGTIAKDKTEDATFTNTGIGDLKISKSIRSRSGNDLSDALKNTDFTFTVNFTEEGKDVEGEYSYTGSKSGNIKSGDTITLKGGESITIEGVEVGTIARVEETTVDNWQASAKALSGDIKLGTTRTATFTNTYQDTSSSSSSSTPRTSGSTTTTRTTTPATADDTNVAVPFVLGALAVGLFGASRVVRSKE